MQRKNTKFRTDLTLEDTYSSAIELLKKMISIPSVSRDETTVADMLENEMARLTGCPVHRHGNNLWVIDPNYDSEFPTLLLNAHIDTVKPSASWKHDPFTPTLETATGADGKPAVRLYGLGSNDDGASVVALLHTFILLTQSTMMSCGCGSNKRNFNLVFLASCEEEVSGKNGIDSVLNAHVAGATNNTGLLPHIDVALVGEPTGMQPAVAEKGLVVLDGVAHGKSGHAARNEGINAIYIALDAIKKLRYHKFENESKTLGPVKVTVTGIQAGTTHNVIPDTCTFMVDVRTTDAYSNEETVQALQQAVGSPTDLPCSKDFPDAQLPAAQITLQPRSTRLQPSGISVDHPLVKALIGSGKKPFGSPTLSDQALMRFPSVKCGPGQSSRSHTADEYIELNEIRDSINTYYYTLKDLRL